MTKQQLDRIRELRHENYSYQFIGDTLGIPMNTVKSACQRYGFVAEGPRKTKHEKQNALLCKYCHRPLVLPTNDGDKRAGRADRAFCSDNCRTKWWRENRKIIKKTTGHFSPSE